MSFNLYNEDGVVGQACSNAGWGELQTKLEPIFKLGGYQELKAFLEKGESDNPKELIKEIKMLLKSNNNVDDNARDTLDNIVSLLPKCKETAIVTA